MRGIKDMVGFCCWLNNNHSGLMERVLDGKTRPDRDRQALLEEVRQLSPTPIPAPARPGPSSGKAGMRKSA